jgi:hypothetical protein
MTTNANPDGALPPPSGRKLLKAMLVAIVIAAIVLVVAVLPAEYGIDPLGAGRALGLDKLFAASEEAAANEANPSGLVTASETPLHRHLNQYRVDTREFTIPPMAGMEFKYTLDKGATMIYEWKSSYFVDFDFHTEPEGAPPGTSDSFEKGTAAQSRGGYTAPYDGIHGWYWENKTDREITLTLTASGFFQRATLFMPDSAPQAIEIPERP